jgi:hypothetical protein
MNRHTLIELLKYRIKNNLDDYIGSNINETYENITSYVVYEVIFNLRNGIFDEVLDDILFENTPSVEKRQDKQVSTSQSQSKSSKQSEQAKPNNPVLQQSGSDQLKSLVPTLGGVAVGMAVRDYGIRKGHFMAPTDVNVKMAGMSPEKMAELKDKYGGAFQSDGGNSFSGIKNIKDDQFTISAGAYNKASADGALNSHEITGHGSDFSQAFGGTMTGIVASTVANILIKKGMKKASERYKKYKERKAEKSKSAE